MLATDKGLRPPTIRKAKVILDAILTTALNDRLTVLHAGEGVRAPLAPQKPRSVISTEQFERIYRVLPRGADAAAGRDGDRDGLALGELTELRVKDLDRGSGQLTGSRAVVHLRSTAGGGSRFLVKEYPKDGRTRRLRGVRHQAVERAEIGFSVRPHDRRHAHASWLRAGGADIQVVKERLGHGSIITTE